MVDDSTERAGSPEWRPLAVHRWLHRHHRCCLFDPSLTAPQAQGEHVEIYSLSSSSPSSSSSSQSGNEDFLFNLVPALDGQAIAFSLQSVNFPDHFLAVSPGSGARESLRLGIVVTPEASNASWIAVPGLSDPSKASVQMSSGVLAGTYITLLSGSLSGSCAGNYKSPSGDVLLTDGSNKAAATWGTVFTPPPPPPIVTIDVKNVTHLINPRFSGCHLDPGASLFLVFFSVMRQRDIALLPGITCIVANSCVA